MQSINVKLPNDEYEILIEKGLFNNIGTEIKKIYKNKKIAIISDSNVDALYGEKLINNLNNENFNAKRIIIEDGEKSKCFSVLQYVCDELLDFNITRGDLIIAFGGGVVGDLAGFAASILLRGIPFIQIPTTLLAQIDSSVGGKTGINSIRGKNLIGSFNQPKAVFIDPNLLKTLDDRTFCDGMAEVIKYGAIRDKNLFDKLLQFNGRDEIFDEIEYVIYTCCNIKKTIVERDEKDNGERMLLNFGHTIGHAVEKHFNYDKYTHGEGVAIGMYAITKNSEFLGYTEIGTSQLILSAIKKYNLPYEIKKDGFCGSLARSLSGTDVDNSTELSGTDQLNMSKFRETVLLDKKSKGSNINLILIKCVGESFIEKIDCELIDEFIKL